MSAVDRTLGSSVWGRKVARLPDRGVLLVSTDLQGNRGDYEAMKAIYARERAAGNDPVLAFCGDMVHGPSPELNAPNMWPRHLGTAYVDASREVILDFERFTREHRAFSVLGNHEHAHIGGPRVPKFYPDEAAVLDAALGDERARVHGFLRTWPLVAVAPCGVVLTHGAPRGTERTLDAFESLSYEGFRGEALGRMTDRGTVGSLLWARHATAEQARALLSVVTLSREPGAFVVYGHDVVNDGYERIGAEQLCLSTSFGLFDAHKTYLRLDLSRRYRGVEELREGVELMALYPDAERPSL
jgi:Calcineurin-like phosphoesterase